MNTSSDKSTSQDSTQQSILQNQQSMETVPQTVEKQSIAINYQKVIWPFSFKYSDSPNSSDSTVPIIKNNPNQVIQTTNAGNIKVSNDSSSCANSSMINLRNPKLYNSKNN